MSIFNPLAPLPPHAIDLLERQRERYRLLGKRVINYRKLAIFAPVDESTLVIQYAEAAARDCFRIACTGWSVLVADTVGVGLAVIKTCEFFRVDYTVVGTGKRPANAAPQRYYQRVTCSSRSRADRTVQRDAYMIRNADAVVCIGRLDIFKIASEMGKQAWTVSLS